MRSSGRWRAPRVSRHSRNRSLPTRAAAAVRPRVDVPDAQPRWCRVGPRARDGVMVLAGAPREKESARPGAAGTTVSTPGDASIHQTPSCASPPHASLNQATTTVTCTRTVPSSHWPGPDHTDRVHSAAVLDWTEHELAQRN